MKIADIFAKEDLERSVLIGYYGGGNFGDELLLEVLMNLFTSRGVQSLTVTYQHLERYATYHHEFNYKRIDMADKKLMLGAILKNKNVVIGGGGLWGLDVNPNIFLLSSLLFISHFVFRKNVYLLGVGYYNSTTQLGHFSAWLAGKSAKHIVTRDPESLENFQKINNHVSLDTDIAYNLPALDLQPYKQDFAALEHQLHINDKTLFISLRRFKANQPNDYISIIEACLANNQDTNIIVATMEPRDVDPVDYELVAKWQAQYVNVQALDFSYNPLALYLFFKQHYTQLALIAPQFHAIITADLAGVPYFPLAYDNKVLELLKNITTEPAVPIKDLTQQKLQTYIDAFKQVDG